MMKILYSRTTKGKIQQWAIETNGDKYRTVSGQKDGKLVTSNWTVCTAKNTGKTNAKSPGEQAIVEAEALWTKKINGGYFEKIEDIDKETFFEPMLAKKYEDYKDKLKFPLFVQPKLDGIRCIARQSGLWTRNGKEIVSVPHIYNDLSKYFKLENDLVLDGELYCDKFNNDFNAICSLTKKTKPTEEDLQLSEKSIEYWVYDYPSCGQNFENRSDNLCKNFALLKYLKLVPTFKVNSYEEISQKFEEFILSGFEGLMVRTDGSYENKRSSSLLKMKTFQDKEFLILDIIEGEGNKSGVAASALLKMEDGRTFNSNIKGNRELCKGILDNKQENIGKLATVQYFNLTPDGIPRFPYLIGVRDYE